MSAAQQILLLKPPLTDPTAPYHSLVYLASFLKCNGHSNIVVRDLNIEALEFAWQPSELMTLKTFAEARLEELNRRESLSGLEQMEYVLCNRSRAISAGDMVSAVSTLRDPSKFYNYALYKRAVKTLTNWLEVLSIRGIPGQFTAGFNFELRGIVDYSSVLELTSREIVDRVNEPFRGYFEARVSPILEELQPSIVGISAIYTSQLAPSIWLARKIKACLPKAKIVVGGTEVSDVFKYTQIADFCAIFQDFDACVVGEGETAILGIVSSLAACGSIDPFIANTVLPALGRKVSGVHYENVARLPTPDYSNWGSAGYLSPEPAVYYSPTRGCYWNRCTFCDYGLNSGKPTSPWRQRTISMIVEDLRTISKHARFIYFSVDVLAPGALVRLAAAIVEASLDIRWATEIRLEQSFSIEACRMLRRSGCVAVSFGFESASQRILDLLDKGVRSNQVSEIGWNFRQAGIAVQMMGFTGFPSETEEEARSTVNFLKENLSWTVAGIGTFALTPGSIVARDMTRFGVVPCNQASAGRINREIKFLTLADLDGAKSFDLEAEKLSLSTADFDRPFAGGIDSAHSMMFYDKFGTDFPRNTIKSTQAAPHSRLVGFDGVFVTNSNFDMMQMFDAVDVRRMREEGVSDELNFEGRVAAIPTLERGNEMGAFFVRYDGRVVPVSDDLIPLLSPIFDAEDQGSAISELTLAEQWLIQAAVKLGVVAVDHTGSSPNCSPAFPTLVSDGLERGDSSGG